MDHFRYESGQLLCDGVPVTEIAARHGTPAYVYSEAALRENAAALRDAFAPARPLICYAVKANDNLAVCRALADEGCGFDIVSGGELFRVLKSGADPKKVVYAGVGKSRAELEAALKAGILLVNAESEPELHRLDEVARSLGLTAQTALRLNPDVDVHAHRHTTTGKKGAKFGIDFEDARRIFANASALPNVRLCGVHMHLGSPINAPEPYGVALERMLDFIESVRRAGSEIDWLDIGGGYGIEYKGGECARPEDYARVILPHLLKSRCRAILEPGRFLVGNAAVLVTRVEYVKESGGKTFVICDAGMNDLVRPALYDSYHRIWPVRAAEPVPFGAAALDAQTDGRILVDVVGPICETGDYLGRARRLPRVREDDLLAVFSAGAYAYSMSSNYNARPRGCEVMVRDGAVRVIRARESYEDLVANERN